MEYIYIHGVNKPRKTHRNCRRHCDRSALYLIPTERKCAPQACLSEQVTSLSQAAQTCPIHSPNTQSNQNHPRAHTGNTIYRCAIVLVCTILVLCVFFYWLRTGESRLIGQHPEGHRRLRWWSRISQWIRAGICYKKPLEMCLLCVVECAHIKLMYGTIWHSHINVFFSNQNYIPQSDSFEVKYLRWTFHSPHTHSARNSANSV